MLGWLAKRSTKSSFHTFDDSTAVAAANDAGAGVVVGLGAGGCNADTDY